MIPDSRISGALCPPGMQRLPELKRGEGGIIPEHTSSPMPAQRCLAPQDPPLLSIGQLACPLEDLSEHLFRQLPSLRVLV